MTTHLKIWLKAVKEALNLVENGTLNMISFKWKPSKYFDNKPKKMLNIYNFDMPSKAYKNLSFWRAKIKL